MYVIRINDSFAALQEQIGHGEQLRTISTYEGIVGTTVNANAFAAMINANQGAISRSEFGIRLTPGINRPANRAD